jgi:hypothetical protein
MFLNVKASDGSFWETISVPIQLEKPTFLGTRHNFSGLHSANTQMWPLHGKHVRWKRIRRSDINASETQAGGGVG